MHQMFRAAALAMLCFLTGALAAPAAASDAAGGAAGPAVHPAPAIDAGEVTAAEVTVAGASVAPGVAFASLAAAVSAQVLPDVADDQLACLAGAVYFESKGEPLLGQLAVARVILNRIRSGRYPGSICGVVMQRSQFSFVRGGVMPSVPDGTQYRTALAIAEIALSDRWRDPSDGALSFHARRVSPGWAMTRVATIGNHIFYR